MPVFLDDLGLFRSTRFAIEDALRVHRATPLSGQLEIETYTWDVLPESLKTGDIVEYVCREIEWVRGRAPVRFSGSEHAARRASHERESSEGRQRCEEEQ